MVQCLRRGSVETLIPLSYNTTGDNELDVFVATADGEFVPSMLDGTSRKTRLSSAESVRSSVSCKRSGLNLRQQQFLSDDFRNAKTRDVVVEYCEEVARLHRCPFGRNEEESSELIGEFYANKYPENSYQSVAAFQTDGIRMYPINNLIRAYSRRSD